MIYELGPSTDPSDISQVFELGDIFIYLIRIADKLDINLLNAVDNKLKINAEKYPADKVRGSAKKYTEY